MLATDILWRNRTFLNGGGSANIYRVAPEIVAKVGLVERQEADDQRKASANKLAVPVLDYSTEIDLPRCVRLEVCPLHGLRKHIVCEGVECLCNEDLAVLIMPEGGLPARNPLLDDRIIDLWDKLNAVGVFWGDPRPSNTLLYEGRLVAADFGLPE